MIEQQDGSAASDDTEASKFAQDAQAQFEQIVSELEDIVGAPGGEPTNEARQALEHCLDIIEGDRAPFHEAVAKLVRPLDVGDVTIYAARLIEAAFTIGVYAGQFPSAKMLARRLEDISPPERAKRPLGVRTRIIAALRKLYPNGDPVSHYGILAEEVRQKVEKELGIHVAARTLDRAREQAYSN